MDKTAVLHQLIFSWVGTPYKFGGNGRAGIDCSGLVIELLQSIGILPHGFDTTAEGLRQRWKPVNQIDAKFGDLVFFGKATPAQASHVGMVLGDGLMVEAGGGTSGTLTLDDAVKGNAWVRVRPIANRKDLLGYARPS
jgi:lipoprotein Spr